MAAQCIDQLRPLTDQQFARREQHRARLLPDRLHRHAADRGLRCRHADRFGIIAIVLAPPDERFDVLWWDQPHPVAERLQRTSPVMRAAASFQNHLQWRQPLEKPEKILPPQVPPQYHVPGCIHPVQSEHRFGRIDGNTCNLLHGRPPVRLFDSRTLAQRCRGAVHPNGKAHRIRRRHGGLRCAYPPYLQVSDFSR